MDNNVTDLFLDCVCGPLHRRTDRFDGSFLLVGSDIQHTSVASLHHVQHKRHIVPARSCCTLSTFIKSSAFAGQIKTTSSSIGGTRCCFLAERAPGPSFTVLNLRRSAQRLPNGSRTAQSVKIRSQFKLCILTANLTRPLLIDDSLIS